MANTFSGNPWLLDTPGATVLYNHEMKVEFVNWYDPANVGDRFLLQDMNGKTILEGYAGSANLAQSFRLTGWYQGLIMPTLDSGRLELHIA